MPKRHTWFQTCENGDISKKLLGDPITIFGTVIAYFNCINEIILVENKKKSNVL